ncbi:MAG: MmcQ/YjbR family DNA-binding protein [Caulobacteraceae bacterium]|nr:MmcQ/YjbR family DNA-binding protein [Caulobacteraceae bacterium]
MRPAAFDAFCRSLPAATHVNQWGGSEVYKVGGKIFAIAAAFGSDRGQDAGPAYTFKASDMAYELLIEQGLARPAPYLARAKWVQLVAQDALGEGDLKAYLTEAHRLVARRLTRASRRSLGLDELMKK